MKELSIEKKAQAYEKVREKIAIRFGSNVADEIFSQFEMSEDEKIRKEIMRFIFDYPQKLTNRDSWLDWLEKKPSLLTKEKALKNSPFVEQKPADKVEQKFKVGDWVVNEFGHLKHITKIKNDCYYAEGEYVEWHGTFEYGDTHFRLWTIQDAKDGDVLVDKDNNIGIYKEIEGICWDSYIYLGCDGKLRGFSIGGSHIQSNTKPATKEQRDLLFKKMYEIGYEWDAENKELIKIEQKHADKKGMNLVEEEMTPFQKEVFCIIDTTIEEEQGLKQVCDKLFALASNEIKKKFSWSEEDEKMCNDTIQFIEKGWTDNDKSHLIPWLKSLKERVQPQNTWKPSDEQMEGLECTIKTLRYQLNAGDNRLDSLYNDLKKLKVE